MAKEVGGGGVKFEEEVAFATQDDELGVCQLVRGECGFDGFEEAVETSVVLFGFGIAGCCYDAYFGTLG